MYKEDLVLNNLKCHNTKPKLKTQSALLIVEGEEMDSCLWGKALMQKQPKQHHPVFELGLPIPFPTKINITLSMPPVRVGKSLIWAATSIGLDSNNGNFAWTKLHLCLCVGRVHFKMLFPDIYMLPLVKDSLTIAKKLVLTLIRGILFSLCLAFIQFHWLTRSSIITLRWVFLTYPNQLIIPNKNLPLIFILSCLLSLFYLYSSIGKT